MKVGDDGRHLHINKIVSYISVIGKGNLQNNDEIKNLSQVSTANRREK